MSPLTIAFLGDTILGDQLQPLLRRRGYDYAFDGIAPLLARADFTVINHEGVLADEQGGPPESPHRSQYWMRADRDSAAALATYGVKVASLANNHVLDHGLAGLASTTEALDAAGIRHCGAGQSVSEARQTIVLEAGGVRIGFLACIQPYEMYASWLYADETRGGCNLLDRGTLQPDLDALTPLADIKIALVHWGRNYRPRTAAQQRWAPRIVGAGADLVIGHHPHVAHPITVVDGAPVCYSLGNGPFGMTGRFGSTGQPPYGLVVLAEIEPPGRLAALEAHLIDVENTLEHLQPRPVPADTAIPFLRTLTAEEHGWRPHGAALRLERPPRWRGPDPARSPRLGDRMSIWTTGDAYEMYIGRWSRLVAREFVAGLGVPAGARWLDVGCGTGALARTVLDTADPGSVVGVDPSEGFLAHARQQTSDERVRFEVGDAQALPFPDAEFDAVLSGLALNFVPRPEAGASEMARVARPGGVVAAYLWDYAGEMQLIRHLWDAAIALSPAALELDEGRRFPICQPDALERLFTGAGLTDVQVRPIDIPTTFRDFEDYWSPFEGGQGPAPAYVSSLDQDARVALQDRLRASLPTAADGSIALMARAWAARGRPSDAS